jgi:DeoD family purine-nucleoside phosphorylase
MPDAPPPATIHLNPSAELAELVLLPGDPHRAMTMAQALLEAPRMFNARRGLWGYTGTTPSGDRVTIQSTGMGGPSAAIVAHELIELGARTLIRTGTCGSLVPELKLSDVVVVAEALPEDGASRALGASGRAVADAGLTRALLDAGAGRAVAAVSTDVFYDPEPPERWAASGAQVIEMEAAAILTVAAQRGARAACLLLVTDELASGERKRMPHDEIEERGVEVGRLALAAA